MKVPPDFSRGWPGEVPRCWFSKLTSALKRYDFIQSLSDYSLVTWSKTEVQINVLVYVDDLILSGNNSAAVLSVKEYLSSCFHMKDLGVLKYFLSIKVARSQEGIFLSQWNSTSPLLTDIERYRRLIRRLLYVSYTRPDLSFVVQVLSQILHAPRYNHWVAVLRVVKYLKGSPEQGILLKSSCDLQLSGWRDSDWASCPLTRRSVSGWVVFLGDSPASWKSKKQIIVARSSAEAEYRSMEVVTYAILDGLIANSHISTSEQLTDIFTKTLGKRQFEYILHKLGIHDPHAPT
ncbi:transmembrane signal receptor [Lithospermum erythrorhizon]|uniref:Transmembrane signal receptor n=1 Tax=Lithospermum erythrorhizon TaxID=34254 RepID=A0AAV3QQK9_LITER